MKEQRKATSEDRTLGASRFPHVPLIFIALFSFVFLSHFHCAFLGSERARRASPTYSILRLRRQADLCRAWYRALTLVRHVLLGQSVSSAAALLSVGHYSLLCR